MASIAEPLDREGLTRDTAPWSRRMATDFRENKAAYYMLLPSVIAFLALVLFPLVTVIVGAFVKSDAVGRLQFDQGLTLANFRAMIEDPNMADIWKQTFLFVFGSVLLTVAVSFPLALILNQKFPGVTLAKALLLLAVGGPARHYEHDLALDLSRPAWRAQLPAPSDGHHAGKHRLARQSQPGLSRGHFCRGLVVDSLHDDHIPGGASGRPAPNLRRGEDGRRQSVE